MKQILPGLSLTTDLDKVYASRYMIAIALTLATILMSIDVTIVSVAVPSMMGNLGATLDEAAWVTTGFILASVIVLPISGWLGDLLGRRNYIALSVLLFTFSSLMCGLATSLEQLVFWRVLQGIAGGGLISPAQVTLMEVFPARELGGAMSIWAMGMMAGTAVGPLLGGWLTETLSWPWIFYVNVPVGVLVFLLVLIYVPDSRFAKKPEQVDFLGLLLLAVGVGCLQALVERGERLGWLDSREIIAYCLISPLALSLLAWRELRCDHPVVDVRVFADRQFFVSMLVMLMLGVAGTSYLFAFPVLMQHVHSYTAAQAGWAIMPFIAGSVAGFIIAGRSISRPGVDLRWFVALGVFLAGLGYWLHSDLTGDSGNADVILAQLLIGIGQPMGNLSIIAIGTAGLRQSHVAGGNGLLNFSRQLGGSLGVAMFASVVANFGGSARAELIRHVNAFSAATAQHLAMFRELVISHGTPVAQASRKALMLLDMEVVQQGRIIAFNQAMAVFALCIAGSVILVPFIPVGRPNAKSGAKPDAGSAH